MKKSLRNRGEKKMDTGQSRTTIPTENTIEPENNPYHFREQPLTYSRIINRLKILDQRKTERTSSPSSSSLVVSSEDGNVTESIIGQCSQQDNKLADWILAFQTNIDLKPANLVKWVIIVSEENAEAIYNSISDMMKASGPNKYKMLAFQIMTMKNNLIPTYLQKINEVLQDGKDFQMLFVILSSNKLDLYLLAVKKRLKSFDFPSACLSANDAISNGLFSIANAKTFKITKKFGMETKPWSNKISLDNLMIVGFDVYQAKGSATSTNGMVCTAGDFYYSITSSHNSDKELYINFNVNIKKCCNAYQSKMGDLPDRIVVFRNGVDGNQFDHIKMSEVPKLMNTLRHYYRVNNKQDPKLSYIVVAKKISTNMLAEAEYTSNNFPSGVVNDRGLTLPLRYHFFLISKTAQKVPRPTSFFVLYDTQGIPSEQMKVMTYKVCHVCFDWSGITLLPFPCLLAYKLAFVVGISYGKRTHHDSAHNITFL